MFVTKQGRILGFPNREWVGRGCIQGCKSIWAGALRLMTTEKSRRRQIVQPTDQQMERMVWSQVAGDLKKNRAIVADSWGCRAGAVM